MSDLHVVVPAGIADPARPSGGNTYDRRVCAELSRRGWHVRTLGLPGEWPRASGTARQALERVLAGIPDRSVVLLDGIVACGLDEVLVPEGRRLRLVVLVHLPLGLEPGEDSSSGAGAADPTAARARERAVLRAAAVVVTTSRWTRAWLLRTYGLAPGRVRVASPGVQSAPLTRADAPGARLLCVAAVTPVKGHDVLVEALQRVSDLEWSCTCVGSVSVDLSFAAGIRDLVGATGLADRVTLTGPRVGARLADAYAGADLVVAPSRTETYGMVVAEALARGVPVVGSDVGGLPEALGQAGGGRLPGILVPPNDAPALAAALRRWLTDAPLRQELRRAARERRDTLSDWSVTGDQLSGVLSEVAA